MSMYRVTSCVFGRGCLLWPVCSLGKTLLAFSLLHFVLQGQTCLLLQVTVDFLLLHSNSPMMKRTASLVLALEGHVGLHRTCQFKLSSALLLGAKTWVRVILNGNQPHHSVLFETAPKCCISDSSVDSEGYYISSKGFFPTVVDIMVIWIKFAHFRSF